MALSVEHHAEHANGRLGNGTATALVIEDDVSIGALLDELLTGEGVVVVRAEGARNGFRLAVERKPNVILLDQRLPDGCGTSVLRALRQDAATCSIPVIMLTGASYPVDGVAPAPDGFVTKPFDINELLSEVARFVPLVEGQT